MPHEDARRYLERVLPSEGNYVAVRNYRVTHRLSQKPYETLDALLKSVNQKTAHCIYVALHSFGDPYNDDTGKEKLRTVDNIIACRSLLVDFDIGEGAYPDKATAIEDIKRLVATLNLDASILYTGHGFHLTFHSDADMRLNEMRSAARCLNRVLRGLGMPVDYQALLNETVQTRIPGTLNYKHTDAPVPVQLAHVGAAYPYNILLSRLTAIATQHPEVTEEPRAVIVANGDAEAISDKCAAMQAIRDTGGNVPEPHWFLGLGALKHCANGEQLAHDWSKGHQGYSPEETQAKFDAWTMPPPRCDSFDAIIGCRATCPHKVQTPLALGSIVAGERVAFWPPGYVWDDDNHVLLRLDSETGKWRGVTKILTYPVNRIHMQDGTWSSEWVATDSGGRQWRHLVPAAHLGSTRSFTETLGAQEIYMMGKTGASDKMDMVRQMIANLQERRVETQSVKQLGWSKDPKGFALGTVLVTPTQTREVVCDSTIPGDIAVEFGTSGTLETWIENMAVILNRPGAEPTQLAVCHAMGSILVGLMQSSNWHGIPIALTGHGGTGKTTCAKLACGFFCNPSLLERQASEHGSTLNAIIQRVHATGSLPVVLDEFSGRRPEELAAICYALANGRAKERLNSRGGTFSNVGSTWYKNSFITSNDSIIGVISQLATAYKVEATQLRVFEIEIPPDYLSRVYSDIDSAYIESHTDHQYGTPAIPYIRYIMANADTIQARLYDLRKALNDPKKITSRERFHRDAVVTATVAAEIGVAMGLLSFDVKNMTRWALAHIQAMRQSRLGTNDTIDDYVSEFVMSLNQRLLVTQKLGDSRSEPEAPHSNYPLRHNSDFIGRACLEDELLFVTKRYINDWCADKRIAAKSLMDALDAQNLVIRNEKLMRLGRGTKIASTPARCIQLDFTALIKNIPAIRSVDNPPIEESDASDV